MDLSPELRAFVDARIAGGMNYADRIISGEIRANKHVRAACVRFRRHMDGDKYFLHQEWVEKFFFFTWFLKIEVNGEWVRCVLEDWQCFVALNMFIWRKDVDAPKYRYLNIHIGRKAGKTTFAAIFLLFDTITTVKGQAYTFANTIDQAEICFNAAKDIAEHSPMLAGKLDIQATQLKYPKKGSVLKSKVSNPKKLDGFGISMSVIDEPHENNEFKKLMGVIKTGQGLRTQARNFVISTAGFSTVSQYHAFVELGKKVMEGDISMPDYFFLIYGVEKRPEDQDNDDYWREPERWIEGNPMLGVTLPLFIMEGWYNEALVDPDAVTEFKVKNLNIFVDGTSTFIPDNIYLKNVGTSDWESLKGKVAYVGIDASTAIDITSMSLMVFDWDAGKSHIQMKHYLPDNEKVLQRKDGVDFRPWIKSGLINQIDSPRMQYEYLVKDLKEWAKDYEIDLVAFDQHGSSYLKNLLDAEGFYHWHAKPVAFTMAEPIKEMESMFYDSMWKLPKDAVLRYAFNNVITTSDPYGNRRFDKNKSLSSIDPAVAVLNALAAFIEMNLKDEGSKQWLLFKSLKQAFNGIESGASTNDQSHK
jgi:phage terminase large subunit-like protein